MSDYCAHGRTFTDVISNPGQAGCPPTLIFCSLIAARAIDDLRAVDDRALINESRLVAEDGKAAAVGFHIVK